MFEREINQTIQSLVAEVLREQTFVPLLTIVEDERIPWRFKPFFTTEVQWWLHNEALTRAANKRFDYNHPELTSLLSYLEQVQFRHARFERDDFLVVLDSAVKLTFNYICRPQTTLKWYIFRGEPVKPLREVMLRFGAFGDYEYFSTVFAEWVERKQSERTTFDAISSTEFERVIRRIDDQILLSCTVEDLLELMSPFFEFISTDPAQGVPIDALIIYFDDKNIKKLVDHLEAYRNRGRTHILRDEFVAMLDELLTASEGEPEADFSTVYQNDELDAVVRQHLTGDQAVAASMAMPTAVPTSATLNPVTSVAPQAVSASTVAESSANASLVPSESANVMLPSVPSSIQAENGEDWVEEEEDQTVIAEEEDFEGGLPTDLNLADLRQHLSAFQEGSVAEVPEVEVIPTPTQIVDVQEDPDDDPWPWETVASVAPEEESLSIEETEQNFAEGSAAVVEDDESFEAVVDEVEKAVDSDHTLQIEPSVASAQHSTPDDDEEDDDDEWLADIQQHIPVSASHTTEQAEPTPESIVSSATEVTPQVAPIASQQPQTQASAGPLMGDVRTFIDAMLERKVIKKVFQRNRSEYESVLDRLNGAQNWKIASQILDELFVRNNVDPYSRTAIRFTDSVYGRYLSTNNRS